MKVKAPLSLDGHVKITKVIATRSQTDEASNEERVSFDELPARVAINDDSRED